MPEAMFKAILTQVQRIPRGKVATYGDVAYAAGFPGASRQVVWALHSSQGLPWHRVVGSGGKILLSGEHAFEQRMRLQAEGVQFHGQRIAMELHHHSFFGRDGKRSTRTKRTPDTSIRHSASGIRRVEKASGNPKSAVRSGTKSAKRASGQVPTKKRSVKKRSRR